MALLSRLPTQMFLTKAGVPGLVFVSKQQLEATGDGPVNGTLVWSFGALVEQGLYLYGSISEAAFWALWREHTHLGQRQEDEFGFALQAAACQEHPHEVGQQGLVVSRLSSGCWRPITRCVFTWGFDWVHMSVKCPTPEFALQCLELRSDLRILPDVSGKAREVDAVVVGSSIAYVGSHKTYIKDAM